ncbi:phosphatase PAP2 family protein [Roseomonas nepalensis]|uniref:Phosphatase PAP2 family protein n=1 Tax=Muricoccus nepalensis TaxID=1854500 RepID=A0A502GBT3_9PROT|nr:vanadium-dependent haloperoxidase [Roseomonas nepalensis]TPG58163.1 phosphatase PAP2 family protein [Roseomonas nepalensis]
MPPMVNAAAYWTGVALETNRRDFSVVEVPPGAPPVPTEQGGPTLSARALALVHLAMHDAYFSVLGTQPVPGTDLTWMPGLVVPAGATSPEGALAAAAEAMLRLLYRHARHQEAFDKARDEFVAAAPASPADEAWGREVATRIHEDRKDDLGFVATLQGPSPARFRHQPDPRHPTQGLHGQQWGKCRPFVVPRMDLAAPPGWPSAFDTDPYYLAEHDEVREKGALAGHTRSADETVRGIFWAYDGADRIGTPPRLYCQIALRVMEGLADGALDTADHVRLLALMTTAMADAGIQAWHWKYHYDFWRPVIGIRHWDPSFGPDTTTAGTAARAHPDWQPLGAPATNRGDRFTPGFPAYPSGHATFGAAAFGVLRRYLEARGAAPAADPGEPDAIAFDFVSDEYNGRNTDPDGGRRPRHLRRFGSLWEATVENSVSRVFLGVHWRFDGISVQDPDGTVRTGTPARPSELGPIGGVRLGHDIAEALMATGLKRFA